MHWLLSQWIFGSSTQGSGEGKRERGEGGHQWEFENIFRVSSESYIPIKSYKILFFQTCPKKSDKLRKKSYIFLYLLLAFKIHNPRDFYVTKICQQHLRMQIAQFALS